MTVTKTHPNDALREALRQVDFEAVLPGLMAYARACLRRAGWADGFDTEPSLLSVEQVIQTAVALCLDGSRTWDPTAVDLPGFLRGIIRSLTSDARKKYVRGRTLTNTEVVERSAPPIASIESDLVEHEDAGELHTMIAECTEDDADLRALVDAIQDGHTKPRHIADALGWTVDRVKTARIKLQRRLVRRVPGRFAVEKRRSTGS